MAGRSTLDRSTSLVLAQIQVPGTTLQVQPQGTALGVQRKGVVFNAVSCTAAFDVQKERTPNTDWVEIVSIRFVWDNVDQMKESMHLGTRILHFPADFAGADNITTNLAKKREPGIEIIERTPKSLIITSIIKFSVKSSNWLIKLAPLFQPMRN